MLPGVLTLRTERGHRSLPVGVEAVPLFACPLSIPPGRQLHISEMVSKGIGK